MSSTNILTTSWTCYTPYKKAHVHVLSRFRESSRFTTLEAAVHRANLAVSYNGQSSEYFAYLRLLL